MSRANGHPPRESADIGAGREGGGSVENPVPVDILADVRRDMATVSRRLLDLGSSAPAVFRPPDPMPAQRLRQLKARITVAAGWGERRLAAS